MMSLIFNKRLDHLYHHTIKASTFSKLSKGLIYYRSIFMYGRGNSVYEYTTRDTTDPQQSDSIDYRFSYFHWV